MTPFGNKLRILRNEKNITQKELARAIGVSPAYLSSLERGNRGVPSVQIVEAVCVYFNIIWEDADEVRRLALLSHPKIIINTSNLNNHKATELTNLLANKINYLNKEQIEKIINIIENKDSN
jgi:transcriptional regulator with XRE-family HTH domain